MNQTNSLETETISFLEVFFDYSFDVAGRYRVQIKNIRYRDAYGLFFFAHRFFRKNEQI